MLGVELSEVVQKDVEVARRRVLNESTLVRRMRARPVVRREVASSWYAKERPAAVVC